MNLDVLKKRTVLFLGKPRAFTPEELDAQLKVHEITLLRELREDTKHILEGRMMSPYEQNMSEALYEQGGFEFLDIESFERALSQEIDDDLLLMSLKLSNDKERLKSFLQNSHISDRLFFKLLKMYGWGGEDFFENDDNRDVTAALIGRFYENIERNHNVQYATTGLVHLLKQTQNEELLEAISHLEPLQFHPEIAILLAKDTKTPKRVLRRFLREGESRLLEALAYNQSLECDMVRSLKENGYGAIVAQNIILTAEIFKELREYSFDLAQNSSLSEAMEQELLEDESEEIVLLLAKNSRLSQETLQKIVAKKSPKVEAAVAEFQKLSQEHFYELFESGAYSVALSRNSATPSEIVQKLFESGDVAVLEGLSRNEATPVDILYQLQLDSRFARAVKTNAAFGRHIQSQNIGWLV